VARVPGSRLIFSRAQNLVDYCAAIGLPSRKFNSRFLMPALGLILPFEKKQSFCSSKNHRRT